MNESRSSVGSTAVATDEIDHPAECTHARSAGTRYGRRRAASLPGRSFLLADRNGQRQFQLAETPNLKDQVASAELIVTPPTMGAQEKLGWINLKAFYADMEEGKVSTTNPGDYVYFGGPGALKVDSRNTNSVAFDTSLFATNATQTFAYHVRTFSTTFPNIRQDGINQLDASMLKKINFSEKAYFQFRFEAFNLFNHAAFGPPNVAATNPSFGLITTQANRSRQIQLGGRLVF